MTDKAPTPSGACRRCHQSDGRARSRSSAVNGRRRQWRGASYSTSSITAAKSRPICVRWDRPCRRSTGQAAMSHKGERMRYTRREVGKLALTALPASLLGRPLSALAQGKPNSTINGVRVGAITYSYRTMPDQSAEATLRYVVDSGISQIEFMGGPVEAFAGAPQAPQGGGRRGGQQTPEQQTAQREAAA